MMTAPQEHAAPAPAKAAKAKKEKAEKPAGPPKVEQNGVVRPAAHTTTGRVWDIADSVSAKQGAPADRKSVIEQVIAEGINPSTGATQYGKWRKFHGLVGADAPGNRAPSAPTPETPTSSGAAEEVVE